MGDKGGFSCPKRTNEVIFIKRLLAYICLLAMLLSLAACDKQPANKQPTDAEQTPVSQSTAQPGASGEQELRYAATFKELRRSDGSPLVPLLYTDTGFYAYSHDIVGQKPTGENIRQVRYTFVSYEGDFRLLEKFEPTCMIENTEGYTAFDAECKITGLALTGAGELIALENSTANYYAGPEELTPDDDAYWFYYERLSRCFLCRLGPDGEELSQVALDLGEGAELSLMDDGLYTDEEGNFVVAWNSPFGETGVAAFREDGSLVYRLSADGYILGLVRLSGGRLGVLGSLSTGEWGLQLIDGENKRFGESYSLPFDVSELIPGDESYDFYYTGGSTLYGYRLETQEKAAVLNWLDCDVNSDQLTGPSVRPDGRILGIENDWAGQDVTSSLMTLDRVPAQSMPGKTELTLATMGLDYTVRGAIVDFNRRSEDCRIKVLDYSEYDGEGDAAGLTRLTTEILAGRLPDLLALSGLPYDQLASKGLLEDLYPYLDADKELNREDFFPTVLDAMEIAGGLYQVCSSFSISTAAAGRSVVGDRSGWTYEELDEVLASMPEGCAIFGPDMTRDDVLSACLSVSTDSLVDWSTGTCRFDSEEFLALLDFAARFPAEPRESEESPYTLLSQGQQLLRPTTVFGFMSTEFDDLYFGGDCSTVYVGYPSVDGGPGSAISLDAGFAMSAACEHKEAAWDFLRTFMTPQFQAGVWMFPSNKAQFAKNMEQDMIPNYLTDSQGNYMLDENGEPMVEPRGSTSFNGTTLVFYSLSQAQADRIMALIDGCTKAIRPGNTISSLVLDEAQAFFAGQKSAEEVARLIQGKVTLYLSEQR